MHMQCTSIKWRDCAKKRVAPPYAQSMSFNLRSFTTRSLEKHSSAPQGCIRMLSIVPSVDIAAHMPLIHDNSADIGQVHQVHKVGDWVGDVWEKQELHEGILPQEEDQEESRLQASVCHMLKVHFSCGSIPQQGS